MAKTGDLTVKSLGLNEYEVSRAGEVIGGFHFMRCRNSYGATRHGVLTLVTGEKADLGCYSYFSDVIKYLPHEVNELVAAREAAVRNALA